MRCRSYWENPNVPKSGKMFSCASVGYAAYSITVAPQLTGKCQLVNIHRLSSYLLYLDIIIPYHCGSLPIMGSPAPKNSSLIRLVSSCGRSLGLLPVGMQIMMFPSRRAQEPNWDGWFEIENRVENVFLDHVNRKQKYSVHAFTCSKIKNSLNSLWVVLFLNSVKSRAIISAAGRMYSAFYPPNDLKNVHFNTPHLSLGRG